jgi:hypothetical protein
VFEELAHVPSTLSTGLSVQLCHLGRWGNDREMEAKGEVRARVNTVPLHPLAGSHWQMGTSHFLATNTNREVLSCQFMAGSTSSGTTCLSVNLTLPLLAVWPWASNLTSLCFKSSSVKGYQ